jgi:hypothetical protein
MYGAPTPSRARFVILLMAFIGGVALFGVYFAPSGDVAPGPNASGRPSLALGGLLSLALGGLLPGTMPGLNRTPASGCTPAQQEIFGKDVVVDTDQWYCGHLSDYGGNVTILGRVSGDVIAAGGNVVVSGEVDGRVLAFGGNITLQSSAHIGGDVQALGGDINASPGAHVGGQINHGMITDQFGIPNFKTIIPVHLDWADVLFWAFSGLISALFLPSQLIRVRLMARRQPAGSLFLGLLAYAIGIVAAVVLVLTCLGIPLALAIGAVLWGGSIFGTAALGLWLGSALVPGASQYRRGPFVLATVIGVTLLAIASTAPVVGGVIRVLVSTAGLGSVLLTIATMRHPSAARRRALV